MNSTGGAPNETINANGNEEAEGKGSIYWYFASKEDLLKAVLAKAFESLGAVIAEAAAAPGYARQKIDRLLSSLLLYAQEWILWNDQEGDTTWFWGIYPEGENRTRLVTRVRMKYHWNSPAALFNLLVEFGDLPMMRKCLLGIKERAEKIL